MRTISYDSFAIHHDMKLATIALALALAGSLWAIGVTGFVLVNLTTNADTGPIENGAVLFLNPDDNSHLVSIRAETFGPSLP